MSRKFTPEVSATYYYQEPNIGSVIQTPFTSTSEQVKKPSNPKDALGINKTPFSTVPASVIAEIGVAMFEGSAKYGRHNYRDVGVRASIYYDAALRHLTKWWEGEDIDPDSGLSHITKALASLVVLRDSQLYGNVTDDRPPSYPNGWMNEFDKAVQVLREKYPEPKEPFTK